MDRAHPELEPSRVAVSLDGADPETNDPIRGLRGAFEATVRSLEHYIAADPRAQDRLVVASTLSLETNYASLQSMPPLLDRLGIRRWALSVKLSVADGKKRLAQEPESLVDALLALVALGQRYGIRTHVNDELGRFPEARRRHPTIFKTLYHPDFVIRVEPAGFVRVGREMTEVFDPATARRYDPEVDDIVEVMGYRESVERLRAVMGARGTVAAGIAVPAR